MDLYGGGPALPHSTFGSKANVDHPINVYLAERDGRPSQRHRLVQLLHPVPSAPELVHAIASLFEIKVPIHEVRLWHRQPNTPHAPDHGNDAKDDKCSEWSLWDTQSMLLTEVLVEVQSSANEWPRMKLKSTRDFRPFRIGDAVDAFDCERVWRAGIVQRVSTLETNRVCIHFTGFSSIFDEWIHEESGKLQPRNSRTLSAKDAVLNPGLPHGGVGLVNLGNTCYLNCSMQCLSAIAAWRTYFLDKTFVRHINRHNKLGTKGKVAVAFASLLANMWKPGSHSSTQITSPFEFRKIFAKVKPQFDGCDQHDGHEFMAALLDAIHEDLNCPTPPHTSPKHATTLRMSLSQQVTPTTTSGSEDSHWAQLAWQQHLQRNQSIVVDLFHGLLRSQTTCGQCGFRRVQFEPCLFLSLPIAQLNAKPIVLRVWMHPLDPSVAPHVIHVTLRTREGNAKMVLDEIANQVSIRADRLRLIQVQQHRFSRLIAVDTLTCDLESAVLCCFERKNSPKTSSLSIIDIQVVHRVVSPSAGSSLYTLVGLPFVLSIDAEATCDDVHAQLESTLRRFVDFPEGADAYRVRTVSQANLSSDMGTCIPHSATDGLMSYFMPPQMLVVDWQTAEFVDSHEGMRMMLTEQPRPKVTLEMCLENFMTQEDIVDGLWTCESCHAADGSRQMDLWKSPDVLMLHLKRFHYSMVQHHKVQELVHFPLEGLQLRPFTGAAPVDDANCDVYDLYAVANHTGGLSEGHYTAYCRYDLTSPQSSHPHVVPPSHIWLNFDDEVVSELPRSKVVSNAAYVLFYRKRVLSTTSVLRVI
ncbi:hypothetical protein DYB32_004728 [Aphanomyces invadans]|uniref:Ubiquitin carboxyl-terminal hydrolase n=1 Tax=Aphanomyces invadans TaxID=157072 RepID=A0A3R6Y9A7_9STRA|nr:hypothetical protein DYB32_004728 [Aphanomyces invadans]